MAEGQNIGEVDPTRLALALRLNYELLVADLNFAPIVLDQVGALQTSKSVFGTLGERARKFRGNFPFARET